VFSEGVRVGPAPVRESSLDSITRRMPLVGGGSTGNEVRRGVPKRPLAALRLPSSQSPKRLAGGTGAAAGQELVPPGGPSAAAGRHRPLLTFRPPGPLGRVPGAIG
jgi:hypothetical protein